MSSRTNSYLHIATKFSLTVIGALLLLVPTQLPSQAQLITPPPEPFDCNSYGSAIYAKTQSRTIMFTQNACGESVMEIDNGTTKLKLPGYRDKNNSQIYIGKKNFTSYTLNISTLELTIRERRIVNLKPKMVQIGVEKVTYFAMS
jgi:hypothetical protein